MITSQSEFSVSNRQQEGKSSDSAYARVADTNAGLSCVLGSMNPEQFLDARFNALAPGFVRH